MVFRAYPTVATVPGVRFFPTFTVKQILEIATRALDHQFHPHIHGCQFPAWSPFWYTPNHRGAECLRYLILVSSVRFHYPEPVTHLLDNLKEAAEIFHSSPDGFFRSLRIHFTNTFASLCISGYTVNCPEFLLRHQSTSLYWDGSSQTKISQGPASCSHSLSQRRSKHTSL